MKPLIALATVLLGVDVFALGLVRDGNAVSTIVIPDEATQLEQEGAQTLVKYIEMASGAALPIVKESEKTGGRLISLGKTKMAARAGVTDRDLKYDGYHLRVKEGTLYLVGRDTKIMKERASRLGAQGSRRAALGLLERLGFRWVQPTPMGVHVPQLKTVSVSDDLDFTHTPIFMYVAGRMYTWGDWSLANSFRKAMLVFSAGGHTWCQAVPKSLYKENPRYFRMQGGKRLEPIGGNYHLCPSNPDVIRLIAEFTIKKFDEGYELVALGQPDGWQPCECDACRALDKPGEGHEQCHYAQYKAIQMAYEKRPDKKVHLLIYGPTGTPSSRIAEYPPNTVTEVCGGTEEQLDLWQPKVPGGCTVYVYYMGLYHRVGRGPTFTPEQASEKIRMLHAHNVKGIYYCGAGEKWATEGPTYYVLGRLATDPSQEWRVLVDEYCDLTFGNAAGTMRQYYDLLYKRINTYYGRRRTTGRDLYPAIYTPEALERLGRLLTLARTQAAGDERALGWMRLAQIGYDQYSLMAKAYHLYQAYQINPTMDSLKQVRDAVQAYQDFADAMLALPKTDRAFMRNYFPGCGCWTYRSRKWGTLKMRSSPFCWNFDALIEANMLPGKTRTKAVLARLPTPPTIDGDPSEEAWQAAPWLDVPEATLGEAEASTRVRLGYDDRNMYVAFECAEPLYEEMKVREYARDGRVYQTECVEMFLAPDGVGQKRMQLVLSPTKEGKWDGRYGYIDDPLHPLVLSGKPDASWNPEYTHAYKLDGAGKKWTIEIAVPFAELGVATPVEGTHWRGNFGRERHKRVWNPRKYSRRSEYFLWSPNLQAVSFVDPAAFGDLYFGSAPANTDR